MKAAALVSDSAPNDGPEGPRLDRLEWPRDARSPRVHISLIRINQRCSTSITRARRGRLIRIGYRDDDRATPLYRRQPDHVPVGTFGLENIAPTLWAFHYSPLCQCPQPCRLTLCETEFDHVTIRPSYPLICRQAVLQSMPDGVAPAAVPDDTWPGPSAWPLGHRRSLGHPTGLARRIGSPCTIGPVRAVSGMADSTGHTPRRRTRPATACIPRTPTA